VLDRTISIVSCHQLVLCDYHNSLQVSFVASCRGGIYVKREEVMILQSCSIGKYLHGCVKILSPRFFFSFFLFFFFCNHALFVSRYKKPFAARALKRKKPINANPPPASPPHGKNQTPRVHRKSLPRLAPKIIYPRHVRKQYMETYR